MKKIYILFILSLCDPFAFGQQSAMLEKYRSMALEYSHDLKAAEKNLAASIELEKSARADLKPKLSGDANFQYTGNPLEINLNLPGMDNPLQIQGRDTKYGASLTLLQPIYTGGRLLESIRMAQHQHALASHQKEQLLSEVCFQTDIQYWNTVARQEIVGIVADYRNSIAALTQTIRERGGGLTRQSPGFANGRGEIKRCRISVTPGTKELRYRTYGLQFPHRVTSGRAYTYRYDHSTSGHFGQFTTDTCDPTP